MSKEKALGSETRAKLKGSVDKSAEAGGGGRSKSTLALAQRALFLLFPTMQALGKWQVSPRRPDRSLEISALCLTQPIVKELRPGNVPELMR